SSSPEASRQTDHPAIFSPSASSLNFTHERASPDAQPGAGTQYFQRDGAIFRLHGNHASDAAVIQMRPV
ncbi:hypothetical protein ABTK67_19185, partial [Acinetobacter baumannii]